MINYVTYLIKCAKLEPTVVSCQDYIYLFILKTSLIPHMNVDLVSSKAALGGETFTTCVAFKLALTRVCNVVS